MRKQTWILLGFLLLKFVLQYILVSPAYDLQRDEYLHLDQGEHLAWGYLSVPPFTSWTSWLILRLGSPLWLIRFFPALFGALTLLVVWKAIEALKGSLFALILGATGVLLSVLLRLNILYQPNSFDVLCWTMLYYCILRYLQEETGKWLYIGAMVFAFAFLNKYNIVFLLLGMAPALFMTESRRVFAHTRFYGALLLGLLLILPNLIWQYQNGWPVVHHMQLLASTQLVNVNRWDFLQAQVLFFTGAFPVIVAGVGALLLYKPFRPYLVFFWSIVFTLTVFLYFRSKDYYAIGIYPIYIAFGAVYLGQVLDTGWRKYLQPVLLLLPVIVFIPMYRVAFPNHSPEYIVAHQERYRPLGMLRWEDGKEHALPQDFADMLGWRELARKVDAAYAGLPADEPALVLCDNYGQAGAINFYTTRAVKAVSFNADYINWIDTTHFYHHLIRVKEAASARDELGETGPFFQTAVLSDSVSNPFAREFRTAIFTFTGARVDIRQRIKAEIVEVRGRAAGNATN
ncbi:glycosyltransferase family 39 protein [Paraflavitalea pollutisoli]|uniref:glycosyltransferase family 39 protein n=1 Tax=Paraflavitalea pollutisoli TaxID=3034143 RepID=UPI0023EDECB2|nr:glycosyltransferase family 39 protein [Paraflavitalea sp. H1-2-19X]